MILDASAIVAILLEEPGDASLLARLRADQSRGVGAPTLLETGMVLVGRRGEIGRSKLERFIVKARLTIVGFEPHHWPVALTAFERFGKGRHPAALNFGDCLAYAIAKVAGEPLLCVGDDFAQTDLEVIRP